jgi:outer membrane protein OmpA-like peptidoglycan-associated protein
VEGTAVVSDAPRTMTDKATGRGAQVVAAKNSGPDGMDGAGTWPYPANRDRFAADAECARRSGGVSRRVYVRWNRWCGTTRIASVQRRPTMNKSTSAASCLALSLAMAPACATRGFVRTEVGQVNDKVTTLGTSLEGTQERVRAAESKISEVDTKAAAAAQSAEEAQRAAKTAQSTGTQALDVGKQAAARAEAVEATTRKLIFETVVTDDQAKFKAGVAELSDEAKAALDQMVAQVKSQKAAIWVEIEGHTDSTGPAAYNEQLGLQRAEAVKRYLYEKHQVPLHKMNAISFGEEKPVGENRTRTGRSQNRRVVVKVLA